MADTRTESDDVTGAAELTRRARRGEERAFAELYRRHAAAAWNLSWSLTDEATARMVTVEAFARSFTALRAGRADDIEFVTLLRNQVMNAVIDADRTAPEAGEQLEGHDPVRASFRSLPLTWQAACWLADGEELSADGVAAVIGLDAAETAALLGRARAGWRERFLQRHVARSGNRNCTRALSRVRAAAESPIAEHDQAALDRHLRLCEPCAERMDAIADLGAAMAAALPVVPVLLVDDVRAAWAAAVTTPTRTTGLAPRTERLLAGATAVVAALGLVGAALVGTDRADNEATDAAGALTRAPAPIVTDVSSPVPLDLAAVADLPGPGQTPAPATTSDRGDGVQPLDGGAGDAVPLATAGDDGPSDRKGDPAGGDPGDGIPNDGPGDEPATVDDVPGVAVSVTVADVPVAVVVSEDPGATVGPISAGSEPEATSSGEPEVTVAGPLEPAQPVVDEVLDPLG